MQETQIRVMHNNKNRLSDMKTIYTTELLQLVCVSGGQLTHRPAGGPPYIDTSISQWRGLDHFYVIVPQYIYIYIYISLIVEISRHIL